MSLPQSPPVVADRQRLSLDLTPAVASLLDHVSQVTGSPRSQVVLQSFLEALPSLVERADQLQARHLKVQQQGQVKGGKR